MSKTITAVEPGPPAKPMGIKARDEVGKVNLSWFANSEPDLAGYDVYQLIDNTWQKVNTELITETSYLVTALHFNTSYIFQICAVNDRGISSPYSDPVEILLGPDPDSVAPWVISTTPVNNQTGVAVNTMIAVNFSENISLDIEYDHIEVKVNSESVEYEIEVNGNSLIMILKDLLPYTSLCEVFIPAGAIREFGAWNQLEEDFAFKFFTGVEPDARAPQVVAIAPGDNEKDVPVNTEISISFNEDIVLGPNHQDILLTTSGQSLSFTTEVNRNVLTLKPAGSLPYSAFCEVSIPLGAISDIAGNQLANSYSFRFFTGVAPDEAPPAIIAIVPADNSKDVPLNAEINLYFSEDLAQGAYFENIELYAGEEVLEYICSINGSILTLKPIEELPKTMGCNVFIPSEAVQDTAGNQLEKDREFRFYTGLVPDFNAPIIQSIEPLKNDDGLQTEKKTVRFAFNEIVQQSLDVCSIALNLNGEPIDFTTEILGNDLTLTTEKEILEGDYLEVTIPAEAIKDVSGNHLEEEYLFTFTKEPPSKNWEKVFGKAGADEAYAVVQTEDGGFVFTGYYTESDGQEYVYLVKVDASGEQVWERKFGGGFHDVGRDIDQTSDGGFIITGISRATMQSNERINLIKTDSDGYAQWEHELDLEEQGYLSARRQAYAVTQTKDGGYLVVGGIIQAEKSDPFLLKTDSLGQVVWIKLFPGTGWGCFYAVEETEDEGFILAGYTEIDSKRQSIIIKTDSQGNQVWLYDFKTADQGQARAVQETKDGGYIVTGYMGAKLYLLKLSGDGKQQWQRALGGSFGYSVSATKDDGYIAAGSGSKGVYVVKTDKTGKMEWEKDIGEAGDVAYSIRQTEDECYIVAGAKNKNGTDAYLIKFEPERKVFLGVSSPNVFEEGMVLVYATIVDGSGKLDTSGKVKVKVKVTGFDDDIELNDAGSEGDFQAKDGVYSKWLKLAGPETVKIELYVDDNDAKKSVEVKVIDEMPLPVVVMTDFEALYKEFRNTGMSPEVDSNKNKIPDYYDLLDRLNKYADNHNGIVVDLQKEITADNSYSPDYSALQYEDNVAIKRYQGPIMIDETTTLKYIAKDQYNNWSKMVSETYTIDESAEIVPTVVAFPKGGKFREAQNVTLVASDPAAEIYYTTDGSDPNEESACYDEPLYISKTTTLKFMAKLADKQSKILKEDYNIDTIWGPRVPAVSAIPGGGTYNEKLWVTLRGTDGAEIYYTTDGSALVADRKKMGELISEYMKRLGHATAFKNLAIIGDDSVVPFYRLESPAPAMNEQKYANSPRDYGNPTLIDTGKDLVMTDIPYTIYGNTDTPENIKKPVIDAGVGRVFATRPANLIKMIDQYEKPITLIPYDRNAAIFSLEDETLDPQNKSAINWPSAVKTALIPVMDKAFSGKGRTAKPMSYERGKYYYYDGSSMGWKAEDVTAAVEKTNITLLWDHATHKDANTKNNAKLVPKDFDKMADSPGHILISNGSHMGYSVSQYSSEADYTPYKTAFVKSILEKKVTYIAPTTYGVGAEPALAYHDLLLQRFLDNLLTTTSSNQATVGEAQIAAYQDYWALTAPKYVDNTSTYATFGTALYGLPTQPVHQQVETKMLNMAPLKANMEIGATNPGVLEIEDVNNEVNIFSIEQIQDTNAFTISMDVPHFNISQHPGGKTSFAVPNSGTFLINAYAPRLPLVTKSYLLPKGSVVNDVTLANETTSIYQDVDLMEFTPVHRTFGSLEGSIEIPDPYPEEIFWWSTDEVNGGTRLSVGIIPLQYNSATRTATLYNHLELSVDYTASSSGTSIDFVNVNYDRPLEADLEDVPIEVRVSSSVRQNVTLRWTIKDSLGLTLESGLEDLELIAGSNVIPFNIDTVGWKPGYKNLIISLSAPDILDATNIEVLVYGLNLEAMLSQGTYLPTEDVGVMAVSIYDETGTPVTGLELGNFIFAIDGQPLSGATFTENEAGKYSFEFPLSGLAEDIHYINFTCQDKRGYQTSESIQFAVATDSTPPLIMETYPEANMAGVDTGVVISVTFNEKIEEGPFYENIVLENEDAVVSFNPAIDGKILTLTPHDELAKGTVYNLIIPAGAIQDLAKNELEFDHGLKFITWSEADTTPPVLLSTEPVEGTNNIPATARASFTFSETIKQSDNFDGITWVTEDENAINFNPILNGEQLILVPLHALPCGTKSLITIPEGAVSDQVGNNLESDLSLSFTIEDGPDLKSPEIVQIIPCANCTGVLTDALVTIRFDKPVFPGENYQWMTWQTDSKAVTFIPDIKGDTLTMTPAEPLLSGTVYTVTLPAGTVTDLAGNDLLSGVQFSFTTGYARDTIPPKVEGTIPADQGEGVLPDAAAYIYFDEAIQESDHFNEITCRIGSTDGGEINFNAQINGRIIILTPQGGLNYDTVYTVDIPVNAVKDLEGNQLADNCTISFTTGGMLDTIAPEVSLIEPGKDNATVNTVIKIYFNDFIKQGSSINDIKILDDHNDEIQYTPVISETTLILTPVSNLNLATTYTVILPVGAVMDLAGNESGEIIYQFTTAVDPAVVSTYDFSYLVPDEIVAGTEIAVLVTFATVDEGDIGYEGVRFKFVAEGPGDVTFKAVDSNDVEHTFINEGYWGPAEGFDLPATYTATTDWALVFSEAGDYTITFSLIDAISEEVIADITDMVTVELTEPLTYSNYQMSIEGPEALELGETGEYAVRAFGDGSGNTSYTAIYNYALTGGVGTLEYKDGEEWKEISLTGQFGPSGGFELSPDWDVTTAFRFTPDEVGTYAVEVNLTEAGGAGAKLAEVAYIIEVAEALTLTVSAAPAGGNYSGPQSITLTASEPGAEIYYTTDGSDPDEESNKYKEPIIIDQTTTLKFKGKDSEGNWSEIYTVNYKISKGDGSSHPGGGGSSQPGGPKEMPPQPELPDMPKELKCPEFPDINGHWAKKEIMYLACQGIVNGYPDGLFRPEKKITRAEFAQILLLSVGPQNRNKIVEFSDIKGHWAESVILARDWRGYPDKTFRPENLISRQETASIIARGMELKPGSLDFLDANNIGEWAKPSVTTLVLCGIINGYPDGTFRPYYDITRAEASVLIYNLLHEDE
ncbi:MAG: Ig-like domain-containing protein [Desulfitobacteriaceae bacterium]|nr:Ig-like domain-containing protein [Desulfitobacteriaceae bacterium]